MTICRYCNEPITFVGYGAKHNWIHDYIPLGERWWCDSNKITKAEPYPEPPKSCAAIRTVNQSGRDWADSGLDPSIRWNAYDNVFLIDFGNIHMSLTPTSALILANALQRAVKSIE